MVFSGVYQIKNMITGQRYIGSSINIPRRWREHRLGLRKNSHPNTYLQRAWNKYGAKNFEFRVLVYSEPFENLRMENFLIPFGDYNLSMDAYAPMRGRTHTEESKELMSHAKEGSKNPMYGLSGNDSPRFGTTHSEKTKNKMRGPRLNMAGENHPMYGKSLPKATKRKLSKSHLKEKNPNWVSFSKDEIQQMRELREEGFTYKEIGKKFSVSKQTARRRILNLSQASTI